MDITKTLWFTGLPCSGKTTLAKGLLQLLKEEYGQEFIKKIRHLDGDIVRKSLCKDLGFSMKDRERNIERVTAKSYLLNLSGFYVFSSFISPTEEMRNKSKGIIGIDRFRLIYVDCNGKKCEERDVKGMWAKARKGEIKNFTGIDSKFYPPKNPDLIIDTEKYTEEQSLSVLRNYLFSSNFFQ